MHQIWITYSSRLEMFVGYPIKVITNVKISVQRIFLAGVKIYNVDYSIAFVFIMNRHFIPHFSYYIQPHQGSMFLFFPSIPPSQDTRDLSPNHACLLYPALTPIPLANINNKKSLPIRRNPQTATQNPPTKYLSKPAFAPPSNSSGTSRYILR